MAPLYFNLKKMLNDELPQANIPSSLQNSKQKLENAYSVCGELLVNYCKQCINLHDLVYYLDDKRQPHQGRDFYKLLEIASHIPEIKMCSNGLTLHLCEAPGDFINATLYLSNNTANWHATSIRSKNFLQFYYQHLQSKKENGHSRVIFGEDGVGDIRNEKTIRCIIHETGCSSASLITADGEINDNAHDLILGELITCLKILSANGCMVLRLPNCADEMYRRVIWICWPLFERLHIMKLEIGEMCNTEIYLVGVNFTNNIDLICNYLDMLSKNEFPQAPSEKHINILNYIQTSVEWKYCTSLENAASLSHFMHSSGYNSPTHINNHHLELQKKSKKHLHVSKAYLEKIYGKNIP